MIRITKHELKRVLPRRQLYKPLCLPATIVDMLFVLGNRYVWIQLRIDINQQMVMTTPGEIIARMRHPHVAQPKYSPKGTHNRCAILWPDYIQVRILWRMGRLPCTSGSYVRAGWPTTRRGRRRDVLSTSR